ncbi:MAG TPA: M20/M25/M40 family metallo-hydrolase [Solirubrobacteraceae bacterium]|nr:M20/M25/M40 family metallo-hydrolase [Solirubrobacteraceae bacterium]
MSDLAARAFAALDRDRLTADLSRLVQVPSQTGDERAAIECLAELCVGHGLACAVHEHDLAALRAHPDYPGEEADRTELVGLEASLPGGDGLPRLCLAGHLDVVGPGTEPWRHGPWSGAVADGAVHGRGAVDMKAGVLAALHAMAAVAAAARSDGPPCEVVLLGVSSEEDGGLGAFAALERDDRYDACLIPEPTDFSVVCAHGGALTVHGVVTGVGAHAAFRLAGISAIDRYVPIHAALAEVERALNEHVDHPLMAELELPYPVLVGQLQAGSWSSQVPDHLEFVARVGVPVGMAKADVRTMVERAVADAARPGPAVELRWVGGQFGSGSTDADHPFARLVTSALEAELPPDRRPARRAGVSYGADMRLFTERGIPCVMAGPAGMRLAHAVDEHVRIDDVLRTARMIVRTIVAFGEGGGDRAAAAPER